MVFLHLIRGFILCKYFTKALRYNYTFIFAFTMMSISGCNRNATGAPDALAPLAQTILWEETGAAVVRPSTNSFSPSLSYLPDNYLKAEVWSPLVGVIFDESPWGISSSHIGLYERNVSFWAPQVRSAGISCTRGFDLNFAAHGDTALRRLKANGQSVSGILTMGGSFPTDMKRWRRHVMKTAQRYRKHVRYWEVWNEPPNFSESDSPEEYGRIVVEAYNAAKSIDPKLQIGLAVRSVELSFLDRAFVQVPKLSGTFDYVTVHPYETLAMVERGWEQAYMSIRGSIRRLLMKRSPAKVDVPVWFTEIGQHTRFHCEPKGKISGVSNEGQAALLVKAYTMGIAQGATRVHWFEAKDGDGNASCIQLDDHDRELHPRCHLVPFGLINGCTAKPRPAFNALNILTQNLGDIPHYLGWITFEHKHFGFLFRGKSDVTMVVWSQPSNTFIADFGQGATVTKITTGERREVEWYEVGPTPVIVSGLSEDFAATALANLSLPFPWGGDFTTAQQVRFEGSGLEQGLHVKQTPVPRIFDGVEAYDASRYINTIFGVDRNFMLYDSEKIRITVVARRNISHVTAGFNLWYESKDGYVQYRGPEEGWYNIPRGQQWHTRSWVVDDAQFVGRWGYNFSFESDSKKYSGYSIRSVTITKI